MIVNILFVIFIGFAGGLTVGAGFVAFLTVLGIIPRLTQLSKTMKMIRSYECAIVIGAVSGALATLRDTSFSLSPVFLIPLGLAGGIFVGLLAAALTEVLNVFPILAKRVGVQEKIISLLMAIVLGKVFGSLFQWLYFIDR
ncbi:stage V sporulation protein AB [Bacillus methanolicus]|uniref:stage V sporulation protein AB n=1 Tax=Bacillus methanolicus TaxID=1471 RepID=UPI00200ED319|nr:stage V sporulation protein AB [Bacillus methanolicus]UQD52615.1 stage V sporulation protein AB [Bacillus methanolicus]